MQSRLTIGFVSTWPIYQGTTIDRYAYSLLQGIISAANSSECNLLLGCGSNLAGNPLQQRSFWPVPGQDVDFLPVGPWNTNGLIIVPDELTLSQIQYIQDLKSRGFPVIFTTPEGPGPLVKVDNTLGIRKAIHHLIDHGHRDIAFIAGHYGRGGDSEERLKAYFDTLKETGLSVNERLVAFGEHRKEDGRLAMRLILERGEKFTAVVASNDLSCLGAIEELRSVGKKIPQDVALIGFDDILDARSLSPSLTTIRHPTFSLGYQAVKSLLEYIHGERKGDTQVVVPPQIIIRQSCGCSPGQMESPAYGSSIEELANEMAEASLIDARNSLLDELEDQMRNLLNAFISSISNGKTETILEEIHRVLAWSEERGEDAHIWQTATSVLLQKMNSLLALTPHSDPTRAMNLLDRIRLEIGDQIQRQITRSMLGHMDMTAQLGQLTAEMLASLNMEQSAIILDRYLPQLGIKSALVALYDGESDDPNAKCTILFSSGFPNGINGLCLDSRSFPFPEVYDLDKTFELIVLPLDIDPKTCGFVAFEAKNPELCAAIVLNLAVALRTSRLYLDAIEGRRMAEEANRLKSRFLSMVSHELRTPLSLIVGLSEMSLREQQIEIRDIEQINTNAQHLARLIGDVLDLASSEAGQLRIVKEFLDLEEVMRVPIKIGAQLAAEKGLTWQVFMPEARLTVLGDRTRLRQVTVNLISNAVKFTKTGNITLRIEECNGYARIAVSDTGIGIPTAELQIVFNEFYRTDRSVESGISGMGLGLAITKELVEQHGGRIEVFSPGDLGGGTTFAVFLPLLERKEVEMESLETMFSVASRVLLLADESEKTETLESFLISSGYSVTVWKNGDENDWADQARLSDIAAIILSDGLASREGWKIAEKLKHSLATDHIPILAYSLNTEQDKGELFEMNYLYKPLQPDLINRVFPPINDHDVKPSVVLVVEDDPGILEMHCRMIQKSGRQILKARNGQEALEVLESYKPDLILLDLMMPVMDGFDFLDQIKASESMRDIPVIILTARILSDADLERCNRGVASILGKGLFTTSETLNHIESAISRQNTLGGATRQLVRKAMVFVHNHYSGVITREMIADQIGISADYLTDCFRQELGITPITYIRRYRIRQACELLRNTDQSITQIAMAVGFSESAHFSHTFLKEMGMTPRAYRLKPSD